MTGESMRQVCGNQRLFILAEPRSGSSWLMETLNSHPGMVIQGELYNNVQFPRAAVFHNVDQSEFPACLSYLEDQLKEVLVDKGGYVGCKILMNQLFFISDDFSSFFLSHYRDGKFIFLVRENLVAQHISLEIAHTFNVWHINQLNDVCLKKVHVYPENLVKVMERTKSRRKILHDILTRWEINHYSLTYERLFSQPQAVLREISTFLGLPPNAMTFSSEKKGIPLGRAKQLKTLKRFGNF